MSKAALNMATRNTHLELWARAKKTWCVSLHPGTVDTALSRPFTGDGTRVRQRDGTTGLFTADECAANLLAVVEGLAEDGSDSGKFFDYAGDEIPW